MSRYSTTSESPTPSQSPIEGQQGQSALDALPPGVQPEQSPNGKKRAKVWCVARIESYGLSVLAACDPEYPTEDLDWSNVGAHTYITTNREEAFQHARTHGGLLLNAETLPSGPMAEQFRKRVQAAQGAPF